MSTQILTNYQLLLNNLSEIINISGYRNDYLAKKIGLKAANFSIKKQKQTWAVDEVEKLLTVLKNDDVEAYLDKLVMEGSFEGKKLSSDEFEKRMKWK